MRKPKSIWEFCGKLFAPMGRLFVLFYLLAQAGVMKMNPRSKGGPSLFLATGGVLLAAAFFLLLLAAYKEKKKKQLLKTGIHVTGTVTSVKQLPYTQWNTSHPYVVRFSYEWDGGQYEGKSGLLWDLPAVKEPEEITVYLDEERPKHSAVQL